MRIGFILSLSLSILLITCTALGATVVTGGWSVEGDGSGSTQAESIVCGSDPAITLGIRSSSSTFGPGSFSFERTGSHSVEVPLGGYVLAVGFNGTVSSTISTSGFGTGYTSSFIGATATGISTGHTINGSDSYDIFGSADVQTEGYLYGVGTGTADADGFSHYSVVKIGTPAEVWGQVAGESGLRLEGRSYDSFSTTGNTPNGLHAESRVRRTILEEESSSSSSRITSYASVANDAAADVFAKGTAESGGWSSDSIGAKVRGANENVASSARGEISGRAESSGYGDAASISAIVQSSATRDPRLYVSGGPATYAASSQSSSTPVTSAEISVKNSTWSSEALAEANKTAFEAGNLTDLRSEVWVKQPGASAISFGKVLMYADYQEYEGRSIITSNFSLDTYSEATKNTSAFASTNLGPYGNGSIRSGDGTISGEAGFVGNLTHLSIVNASEQYARAANIVDMVYVNTNPLGFEVIRQPARADTISDPNAAWARTEGAYFLAS